MKIYNLVENRRSTFSDKMKSKNKFKLARGNELKKFKKEI